VAFVIRGIGIDAVDIQRFRRSLERTPSMQQRIFTDDELAYVAPKADPIPSLAARFASREAVMKAMGLGLGAFGFHDVSVRIDDAGVPRLLVTGQAARLATARGIDAWHLSLAHDGGVSMAMVVADGDPPATTGWDGPTA